VHKHYVLTVTRLKPLPSRSASEGLGGSGAYWYKTSGMVFADGEAGHQVVGRREFVPLTVVDQTEVPLVVVGVVDGAIEEHPQSFAPLLEASYGTHHSRKC
jgi:hypothetical protein